MILPVQREVNIRRRRSPGFSAIRLSVSSDGSICGFCQTGSSCLLTGSSFARSEVVSFGLDTARLYNHTECEGVLCFNPVFITFVRIVGAHAGFFGRPLQVTVREKKNLVLAIPKRLYASGLPLGAILVPGSN